MALTRRVAVLCCAALLIVGVAPLAEGHGNTDNYVWPSAAPSGYEACDNGASILRGFNLSDPRTRLSHLTLGLKSFVPTPPEGWPVTVNIRAGAPDGPVVASSTTPFVDDASGFWEFVGFEFSPELSLGSGTHYIELLGTHPDTFGWAHGETTNSDHRSYGCAGELMTDDLAYRTDTLTTNGPDLTTQLFVSEFSGPGGPADWDVGDYAHLTLVVTNGGDTAAPSYSTLVPMPAGATVLNATIRGPGSHCTVVPGLWASCDRASAVNPGDAYYYDIIVGLNKPGPTVFRARVTGPGDPDASNDLSQTAIDVGRLPDDTDGDGILDRWETPGEGMDVNNDGQPDLFLATGVEPYNARPDVPDVFVEVDWLACTQPAPTCSSIDQRRPSDASIAAVSDSFAAAGVALHLVMGERIPFDQPLRFSSDQDGPSPSDDTTVDAFDDLRRGVEADESRCDGWFGTPEERAHYDCAARIFAREKVFRYLIAAGYTIDNPGGQAELPGNDFAIAIDQFGDPAMFGGRDELEPRVLMHELGHTLGLYHGGDALTDCKPNYLSVMNGFYAYEYSVPGFEFHPPLDYSHDDLPDLDERALDEPPGISGPAGWPVRHSYDYATVRPFRDSGAAQDWNNNQPDLAIQPDELDVEANVNQLLRTNPATGERESMCADGVISDDARLVGAPPVLTGHDDWANLVFHFRAANSGTGGAPSPWLEHPTPDETRAMIAQEIADDPRSVPVTVEVRPGSADPTVNPSSKGSVPVAVITTPDFDATTVDPATVCFGSATDPDARDCTEAHRRGHLEDVDGDGDVDLLLHFEADETGIARSDTSACLTGSTRAGVLVEGCDSIRPSSGRPGVREPGLPRPRGV